MSTIVELTGSSYLTEVTALLQRARREHPTQGLWEAADRQWSWRTPRHTDDEPQSFWYDEHGPVAATVTTGWSSSTWLDLITLPSSRASLIREMFDRSQGVVAGIESLEMPVDDDDRDLIGLLTDAGFRHEPMDVTAWMNAGSVPDVSSLADGYTLHSRASTTSNEHHLARRNGTDVEHRLGRTSLYRPDLDVFVVDQHDDVVAYGLFWHDPTTGVGLVEPMRTEEPHQGKGLARHVLTTGLNRLVAAGSDRVKISYDPDNPPAATLYLSVGFVPTTTSSLWSPPAT